MTTGWPGLTFSVMAFNMFAAWCTIAGAFTGSCLKHCIEVLKKYAEKLIRSLTSSGSVDNFYSHSLGCADLDPSRKNKSGSMSEETGGSGFPKTIG